jgi:hypothetical protein
MRGVRQAFVGTCVTAALLGMSACAPPVYFAKSTHGTVVDADTGQPVAGAVVVAQWIYYAGFIMDGGHGPRLKVMETTTDATGRYGLPWWGPRLRRPLAFLDYYDPRLLIYKHQYEPLWLSNQESRNGFIRFSEWDDKTLRLKPFHGTDRQLVSHTADIWARCSGAGVPLRHLYEELLKDKPVLDAAGESYLIDPFK